MRMTGQEGIAAPRNWVWEALNDPDVLRQCIPGCKSLERQAADKLRATVELKIGPIGARFNSVIALSEVHALQSYTLTCEGQGGTTGTARATISVRLADDATGTLLSYDVNAEVGGRLAQLGGPIIDATAQQLAAKFFKRFGEVVGGSVTPAGTLAGIARGRAALAAPALPIAWILALVVTALVGFSSGRASSDAAGSSWMGIAIALLAIVAAAAGFIYGRNTAAPHIVLDAKLLERLLREELRGGQ